MSLAYQGRTYGDLVALTRDLPAGPPPVAMPQVRQALRKRARPVQQIQHTNAMATAAFALAFGYLALGIGGRCC